MTALNPVLPIATQAVDVQYRTSAGPEKRRRAIAMLKRVGIPDAERRIERYLTSSRAACASVHPHRARADRGARPADRGRADHGARCHPGGADHPPPARAEGRGEGGVLFVSHHLGLVVELCDRVIVMYAGEVVETGTVHDVFHRPQHLHAGAPALRSGAHRAGDARAADDRRRGAEPRATARGLRVPAALPYAFERCLTPPPLYPTAPEARRALPPARPWLSCSGSTIWSCAIGRWARSRRCSPASASLRRRRARFRSPLRPARRSASSARAAAASRRSGARSWVWSGQPVAPSISTA